MAARNNVGSYYLTLDTRFIDPLIDFLSKYRENWIF